MFAICDVTLLNALGRRPREILDNWAANHAPGMKATPARLIGGASAMLGHVADDLPELPFPWGSRNNRLIQACLDDIAPTTQKILARFSPDRIGVILGTSTAASQEASTQARLKPGVHDPHYDGRRQELGDLSRFVAMQLGVTGPAYVISTACTSSARAIISGARALQKGLVDAVLVGGADTLADMPMNGFDALGVLDHQPCQPLCQQRRGINIGEGGGLMWLTRMEDALEGTKLVLAGFGESTDAYHMSQPHPEGQQALSAMRQALAMANAKPEDVVYVNLHGTATPANDKVETQATYTLFGTHPWVSSTKTLTGHTLGAAGITDVGLCCLLLSAEHPVIGSQGDYQAELDPEVAPLRYVFEPTVVKPGLMMSNNFAFGGNNTSLLVGPYHGQ